MRTRIITLITLATIFLVPTLVLAHPGHGTFNGHNLGHYLTSPVHLISTLAVIAVTVFIVKYVNKRREETND
jgi:membrane-anchored glycerophosphoryl diester phosphodiesterase (GDPDase)